MLASSPSGSPATGWPVGFWWAELAHPCWEFTEAGYEVTIASPDGEEVVPDGFSDPDDDSGYSAHDLFSLGFKRSPQHAALMANTSALADVGDERVHRLVAQFVGQRIQPFWIEDEAKKLPNTNLIVNSMFKPFAVRDVIDVAVLIECANPIGPGLTHGLSSAEAGSQVVARLVPGASVVKAFSIYGWENLADNAFPEAAASGIRPVMMLAGDDLAANALASGLADGLGWEPLMVGGLEAALQLEHLTLLWVRMVRLQRLSPHLVWAKLERSG